jgi:hypothetical protein
MSIIIKTSLAAAAMVTTLALASPSKAADGYDWFRHCSAHDGPDQVLCRGYMLGIWDMMQEINVTLKTKLTCGNPESVDAEQLRMIFVNYGRKYPQKLMTDPSATVMSAFTDAWSCAEAKKLGD